MARNEGKITKNEFDSDLKNEYSTAVTNALNAKVTIGTGTLGTTNKTIIPAINELKNTDTTLSNSIGTLSSLLTNNKGNTVAAINELFQSGVDLQNIAKSALNAAGISYTDTQLKALVQTMSNNLYSTNMHNNFINKLNTVSGSNIANTSNTFDQLVNMISSIGGGKINLNGIQEIKCTGGTNNDTMYYDNYLNSLGFSCISDYYDYDSGTLRIRFYRSPSLRNLSVFMTENIFYAEKFGKYIGGDTKTFINYSDMTDSDFEGILIRRKTYYDDNWQTDNRDNTDEFNYKFIAK